MMFVLLMCIFVHVATEINGQSISSGSSLHEIYAIKPDAYIPSKPATSLDQSSTQILSSARVPRKTSDRLNIEMFMNAYQPFEIISRYLDQLAASSPLATTLVIGSSYEGRPIKVIQISANDGRIYKPIIVLQTGLQGNAVATIPTAIYVAYSLINGYHSNAKIKRLLEAFEFHIFPIINPDGYTYARTVMPTFNLNRAIHSGTQCIGANLNRNWKIKFNEDGSGREPCLFSYPGPYAFSEIETHVVSNYLRIRKDQIKLYMSMFENHQAWLSPYFYTKELPKNYMSILAKSKVAVAAIAKVSNVTYEVGTGANLIMQISGGAADWLFDIGGVPYSYGISLRTIPIGGGPVTPSSDIKPIAEELWAGIVAISDEIYKEHINDNLRNLITGCRCKSRIV